jgi:hypothetical protein
MRGVLAVLLPILILPAAASAAETLTTDQPCYVEGERVAFMGTGWTPGRGFEVDSNRVYASGFADASGTFTTHDKAPVVSRRGIRPRTETVTGREDGKIKTHASFKVVGANLFPTIDYGSRSGQVMWHVSGLLANRPVYFHTVIGGKTYTTRLGTGDVCGSIKQRLGKVPGVPAGRLQAGTYRLYADNRAAFRKGGRQQLRVLHV